MSEEKLQREIQYLTRLIESHKARGSSNHKVTKKNHYRPQGLHKYKWNNNNTTATTSVSKVTHKSSNKPRNHCHPYAPSSSVTKRASQHGNLVYRPVAATVDGSNTAVAGGSSTALISSTKVSPSISSGNISSSFKKTRSQMNSPRRKRKVSKSKGSSPALKNQNKYVWKASTESASSQLESRKLPNKRQLKWRRASLDKKQPKTSQTNIVRVKLSSKLSPSKSNRHTPLKSRYKWKRRTSQESKLHISPWKVPQSPLVARGKYSLVRSSLLGKHFYSKEQSSFQYRRLKYILKHTPSRLHMKRPMEARKNSGNRVWTASMKNNPSQQADSQPLHKTKLHRGNKVWTSSDAKSSIDSRKTSSKTSLVLLGERKYMLDSSKRRLKRTSSSSVSTDRREASVKNYLASCAVQRSRKHIWLGKKHKNKVLNKFKHYCIFFNKFGKCSRGDKCPYVHDPERVAVCPKFLKGTCEETDGTCLLSHKVKKEKMPVCSFFLRGICARDTCPYLHVSVDRNASVCPDFITGYCPRGEQCTLQHVLDCPEFLSSGSCSKGKNCPLRHHKIRKQKNPADLIRKPTTSVKTPMAFRKVGNKKENVFSEDSPSIVSEKTVFTNELEFIPLDCDEGPDFIAL